MKGISQDEQHPRNQRSPWKCPARFQNYPKTDGSVSKPIVPLVNIKIAGKWMFIPLKMVLIGIDPDPYCLHKENIPLPGPNSANPKHRSAQNIGSPKGSHRTCPVSCCVVPSRSGWSRLRSRHLDLRTWRSFRTAVP